MIFIPGIQYTKDKAVNKRIIEYVNNVLAEIVQCQIELHHDQKSVGGDPRTFVLESISIPKMYRESPTQCENTLRELYDLISSRTLRYSIQPRYNYMLFHCIDNYLDFLNGEDEFINQVLPEPLYSDILSCKAENLVGNIGNVEDYPNICFDDWDFLPEYVSEMVALFLDDSPFLSAMISIEELDNLVEVMPADLQEKYLKKRATQHKAEDEHLSFSEKTFTKKLLNSLFMIQGKRNLKIATEDELNDEMRNYLAMVYDMHDQTRQGVSLSGLKSGEVDLLVYEDGLPAVLIEAVKLNSVEKENIGNHIHKALCNYNPSGLKCVCFVIYSKASNYPRFLELFREYIKGYDFPYLLEDYAEIDTGFAEINHMICLLSRGDSHMHFHIFIANMQ